MQQYQFDPLIEKLASRQYFVIDAKINQLYPEIGSLLKDKDVFSLENPESIKNIKTCEEALDFFLENKITRKDEIVVIGGGATTDIGGFVAATILRGIPWLAVPTTLLGMIDAAIGGKVGVNSRHGKNLIGAFHQPTEVLVCKHFLSTLPEFELISGKGELLKYFFLDSEIKWQGELDSELLLKCAKIKDNIVQRDFKEKGERKLLNLGHTLGHAFEKTLGISHGYAVALGLKIKIDLYASELKTQFEKLAAELDINFDLKNKCDFNKFENFLRQDKKRLDQSTIEIIVPRSLGNSEIVPIKIDQLLTDIKSYENYQNYFK